MSFNKLYKGKVIFDSDRLKERDNVPLNRVKVYISGVTPAGTESFKQPRGATNENTITISLNVYVQEKIQKMHQKCSYNPTK